MLRVSTPHTRELLQRFNQQAREVGAALLGTSRNSMASTKVHADLESLTLRSAFSHLPLLHDLEAMVQWAQTIAGDAPAPAVPGMADQVGVFLGVRGWGMCGRWCLIGGFPSNVDSVTTTQDFRPSCATVELNARKLAWVLCNDQPASFGAPDVLEVELQDVTCVMESNTEISNRPPTMGVLCRAALAASFLNNSSSRWDRLVELCRIGVDYVDFSSPVFTSDRRQYVWNELCRHVGSMRTFTGIASWTVRNRWCCASTRQPCLPSGTPWRLCECCLSPTLKRQRRSLQS